jgi:hypothetical protein
MGVLLSLDVKASSAACPSSCIRLVLFIYVHVNDKSLLYGSYNHSGQHGVHLILEVYTRVLSYQSIVLTCAYCIKGLIIRSLVGLI